MADFQSDQAGERIGGPGRSHLTRVLGDGEHLRNYMIYSPPRRRRSSSSLTGPRSPYGPRNRRRRHRRRHLPREIKAEIGPEVAAELISRYNFRQPTGLVTTELSTELTIVLLGVSWVLRTFPIRYEG